MRGSSTGGESARRKALASEWTSEVGAVRLESGSTDLNNAIISFCI